MTNLKIYIWSSFNRFGSQAIGFIGNILIARQLTPDDYGLIAMLAIFMGIAVNFMQSGFADCLIQKADANKKDFGTVHTYNVVTSLLMYGLIVLIAPFLANFYGRNELINISQVLGISIIIRSLSFTEFVRLKKDLLFESIAIVQLTSKIISIGVTYMMAIYGFGYWSLVFQVLILGICEFLLLVIVAKYKPRFYFSLKSFKEMSGFSFNLLISYYANTIGHNLITFLIGKFHSAKTLGFYYQAQLLNSNSILALDSIISTTTFPVLAKETKDSTRLKAYLSLLRKFLFIQFLIGLFLIGSIYPIIDILYGDKWIDTVPYFQLLVLAYLFFPLSTLNINMAKVYGKGRFYRNLTFIKNGLLVIALLITINQSVWIMLIGQMIGLYIFVYINMKYCGRIINFSVIQQLKTALAYIWIPLLSLIISYITSYYFDSSIIKLIIFTASFFSIFILLNELINQKAYNEIKFLVIQNISLNKKK